MMSEKVVLECKGCDRAIEFLVQEIWLLRRSRSELLRKLRELRRKTGEPEVNDE